MPYYSIKRQNLRQSQKQPARTCCYSLPDCRACNYRGSMRLSAGCPVCASTRKIIFMYCGNPCSPRSTAVYGCGAAAAPIVQQGVCQHLADTYHITKGASLRIRSRQSWYMHRTGTCNATGSRFIALPCCLSLFPCGPFLLDY